MYFIFLWPVVFLFFIWPLVSFFVGIVSILIGIKARTGNGRVSAQGKLMIVLGLFFLLLAVVGGIIYVK